MKWWKAAMMVLALGSGEAQAQTQIQCTITSLPKGGVVLVDPNGNAVAPYIPNQPLYFDAAGFIWRLDGYTPSGFTPIAIPVAYESYYTSAGCAGTEYVVVDPATPVFVRSVIQVGAVFLAPADTQAPVSITIVSARNGATCTNTPWPSGGQAGWLKSAMVPVSGPPPMLYGALHLEWR